MSNTLLDILRNDPAESSSIKGLGGCSGMKRERQASSDSPDETRLKKPRAPSSDSDSEMETALMGLQRTYKRDTTYYMEDGSCILLVEDTLFNVHRTILSKDSSSFSTMFALPQGSREAEGRSDDNPIILTGDTVAEFQHFLWALYALPPELKVITSPSADLTHLIDIARISNKYSFKTLETWALDTIQEYVNRKPSQVFTAISTTAMPSTLGSSSPASQLSASDASPPIENVAQLTKLMRLAQMCNHEQLLSTMIDLLRQLMSSSLRYAYLAMTLADELDLRTLRGAAYLEVMQKAVVVKRAKVDAVPTAQSQDEGGDSDISTVWEDKEGEIDGEGRLIVSRAQQLRLLSGYYRLSRAWESLRIAPPHFVHAPSCGATWHQHGCTQSWLEFWKDKTRTDAVLALDLADVLGRLKQVQKDYDRWGSATYMHHDCRMAARRSILGMIKTVEDGLPDYFSEAGDDN